MTRPNDQIPDADLPDYYRREAARLRSEADTADYEARAQMSPERVRIDLGAGQERQQYRAERGEKVDPGGRVETEEIPAHDAHHDFDEGDRYPDSD